MDFFRYSSNLIKSDKELSLTIRDFIRFERKTPR